MITHTMLRDLITKYNELCGTDIYMSHQRPTNPWAIKLDGTVIVSGTKREVYYYLSGAITAISTFKNYRNCE